MTVTCTVTSAAMHMGLFQGGFTYIGAVHIAATGVKILDRPKISLDLLTTPDLCPSPFDPSVIRMRNWLIDVILTIHSRGAAGENGRLTV